MSTFKYALPSVEYQLLKPEQKALEINLNDRIYGTFAEIGAGQEVARNFFQVGASSGTIVKTMSAYDKAYSDAIYGIEKSGRYVCESRLYKMLDHEYLLIEERLQEKCEDQTFFVFADTVAAINYSNTIKGNGWIGVRFQHIPCMPANDVAIHVKMKDNNNSLQQEAIGILGVNLLYACFFYRNNMNDFIKSLKDNLEARIEIDFIRVSGAAFDHTDNRLLSYYLVKNGLTEVAMFDHNGSSIHASEFLYKHSLMVVRGNFKPPTLVTQDVIQQGFAQFKEEPHVNPEKSEVMAEITLEYLKDADGHIDEADFMQRAELLCALGVKVIVSSGTNHQMLINYLKDHKVINLGLVIGARELLDIIVQKYEENQDGRLLTAFGELFTRNIKIYVYPALESDGETILNSKNLPVPEGIKFLYKHLTDSEHIVDIEEYNTDNLIILPQDVRQDIATGGNDWKQKVPNSIVDIITQKNYFR